MLQQFSICLAQHHAAASLSSHQRRGVLPAQKHECTLSVRHILCNSHPNPHCRRRLRHTATAPASFDKCSADLKTAPFTSLPTFGKHSQTFRRRSVGPLCAKKAAGGGKKAGKGGKVSPLANLLKEKEHQQQAEEEARAAVLATPEQHSSPEILMYLMVLTQGYWQQAKEYLLEGADFSQLGSQVFDAPFAVIAQDKYTEAQAVSYANRVVLELLGGKWGDVVGVGTSKFAGNNDAAGDTFFSPDGTGSRGIPYEGSFVSLQGKKFAVKGGTLFDINGPDGAKIGQGLKFTEVVWEDGTVQHLDPAVAAAREAEKAALSTRPASIQEAEAWVKEQGDLVRTLKSDKGLTNQDEEVIVAVEELLQRKQHLETLKAAASA